MHKRKDYFYKKAKNEAYLARSAYKLSELDEKFRLFHHGQVILDLGTSPGSWAQYLLRHYGPEIRIVGVDCLKSAMPETKSYRFVEADILSIDSARLLAFYPHYDGVISDAAPNTTGTRWCDASRSLELCRAGWKLSQSVLKQGGFFVCKIFQGEDVTAFQRDLQNGFESVRLFKPKGSRDESPEVYLVALDKK